MSFSIGVTGLMPLNLLLIVLMCCSTGLNVRPSVVDVDSDVSPSDITLRMRKSLSLALGPQINASRAAINDSFSKRNVRNTCAIHLMKNPLVPNGFITFSN